MMARKAEKAKSMGSCMSTPEIVPIKKATPNSKKVKVKVKEKAKPVKPKKAKKGK
jgi:hypothetical protein